jgi:F-type H+-transporting ATPase subunit delta
MRAYWSAQARVFRISSLKYSDMSEVTVANRYARALADIITERDEIHEITAELERFADLISQHEQLRSVFASPVVPLENKRGVLDQLLSRLKFRQTSNNFLRLLLANSRLHDLDLILTSLSLELDSRSNVVSAEVTTAREISEREKVMMRDKLKAATGKEVRLQFRTDPKIIGGVVTRIGSLIYDGSIRNQLAQMKHRLINAES